MKIALVHELLTMRGGAERVLRIIADMYPDAPIYTLLYDEKKLGDWFPSERVRTSSLQKYAKYSTNHHLYLPFFPNAVEEWDFSEYDCVLSASSAFAHGILTNGSPRHLSYIHSPARYLWDRTHDVQNQSKKGLLGPLKNLYLSRMLHKLRIWDSEAADRADMLLAASEEVQTRIQSFWRRDCEVLHPPIDNRWLESMGKPGAMEHPEYYLIVSTLVPYKRIEIAIQACNALSAHLKIVGEGPDRKRLESIAGKTIEFYGRRTDDELQDLYTGAKAVLFPGEEDFGLVPLEAMSQGTPVLAYRSGGALETILEGVTGEFFDSPNAQSLQEVLKKFNSNSYSGEKCRERASDFSPKHFEKQLREYVDALMS